jgi:hypothetical protein
MCGSITFRFSRDNDGDVAVESALLDSSDFLLVLSPPAVASTNVMDEVTLASDEKKRVILSYVATAARSTYKAAAAAAALQNDHASGVVSLSSYSSIRSRRTASSSTE